MLAFADDTTVEPYRAPFAEPDDPYELTDAVYVWLEGINWNHRNLWGDGDHWEIEPAWLVLWIGTLDPHVTYVTDYPEEAAIDYVAEIDADYGSFYCKVELEATQTGPWLVIKAVGLIAPH